MRALLLGTDFMYNSDGKLVPIELNTDVSMDALCVEDLKDIFDLTELFDVISNNGFTKVSYIGMLELFGNDLKKWCKENGVEYQQYHVVGGKTVPYLEDDPNTLIIRSAFDETAIVDIEYCANKVNFLNLIKSSSFSLEFVYMGEDGKIVNNITKIPDNGTAPNFILKAIYPHYDRNVYPKYFKVNNWDELNVVLQNVDYDYFLMENLYNPNKLYDDHVKIYRSYNILIPPMLENITVGQYTKLSSRKMLYPVEYNPETFELISSHRRQFLSSELSKGPKLIDTDQVEMADDTFKSALELQEGDLVKTIDIYNPHDTPIANPCNDFKITYEEFMSGTTYSQNVILGKQRVELMVSHVTVSFTDGTIWEDTETSSYLILRDNNVQFGMLSLGTKDCELRIGDEMILIKSDEDILTTVLKEVADVTITKKIFSGWEITVEDEHLFLTKSEESTSSYVGIEHNACGQTCCVAVCDGCTIRTPICCSGTCMGIGQCLECD